MSGLSAAVFASPLPLVWRGMTPAPLPLPDAFHSAPAGTGTEAPQRRSRLVRESFIAAGAVATVIEKNPE